MVVEDKLNSNVILAGEIKPNYYHKGISPFEYIRANKLDFFEGNIIKYVTRYKDKNGLEDLIKAKTYLDEIIKNYKEG